MTPSTDPDLSIVRLASLADLAFVRSAAKTATDEIGFLPWTKIAKLQHAGQVAVLTANGDTVGFVVHGRTAPVVKIWQIWMRNDARRVAYGTALLNHVVRTSTKHDAWAISLRCATDLPAIAFWEQMQFTRTKRIKGGRSRKREISVFHRSLTSLERLGLRGPSSCSSFRFPLREAQATPASTVIPGDATHTPDSSSALRDDVAL